MKYNGLTRQARLKIEADQFEVSRKVLNQQKKELQQKEDAEIFRQKQAEQERIRKLPYFQFL